MFSFLQVAATLKGLGSDQDLTNVDDQESQAHHTTDPVLQPTLDTEKGQFSPPEEQFSPPEEEELDTTEKDGSVIAVQSPDADELNVFNEEEISKYHTEPKKESGQTLSHQASHDTVISDASDLTTQEVNESVASEDVETYVADIIEKVKFSESESAPEQGQVIEVNESTIVQECFVTQSEVNVEPNSDFSINEDNGSEEIILDSIQVDPIIPNLDDVISNGVCDVDVTPEVNKSESEYLQEILQDPSETVRIHEKTDDQRNLEKTCQLEITTDMPGKREDEVLSPALQSATFRYRWAKTVRTNSQDVLFFPSYKMEEPIKLTWSDSTECYFSGEMTVATGIYKGHLVIDGERYPIEDLTIKHYTFEADIYVREDILESETNNLETEENEEEVQKLCIDDLDTRCDTDSIDFKKMTDPSDASIHVSSKYEELVKKQMSDTYSENELNRSMRSEKSDHGSTGRRTPIGDVSIESFQDGGDGLYMSGSVGDRSFNRDSLNNSVVEDEVERPRSRLSNLGSGQGSARQTPQPQADLDNREIVRSAHSSARQTPQKEVTTDVYGREGSRTPQRHEEHLYNGSEHQSPNIEKDIGIGEVYRSPLGSLHNSARQTPNKESVDDVLGNDSLRSSVRTPDGSVRLTPQGNFIDDVLGQSTPKQQSEHGSEHGSLQNHSTYSSARHTPQLISDSFRAGQDKLYNPPGSGGSRPQSVTSEQELAQYFDTGSRHSSLHGSLHGSEKLRGSSHTSTNVATPASERAQSTSSLPVITTQQRLQAELRTSMTPDNLIRVPDSSSPALRGSVVNRPSSRVSDRTITPTSAVLQENGYTESLQVKRIQDLEDSVRNLRKLLSNREEEVHQLTGQLRNLNDQNASLTSELDRAKMNRESLTNTSLEEMERKYKQMRSEKEILAAEVVKLRDQIDSLSRSRSGEPDGGVGGEISHGINSYDPNNPYVLQRRIADLQSQVQDLQEANECAVAELSTAEKKLDELKEENKRMKSSRNLSQDDLEAENKRLQDQITRLYEQGYGGVGRNDDEHLVKIESQQLKDDNRALRERNYKLHEENVKLRSDFINRAEMERPSSRSPMYTESRISAARGSGMDRHSTTDRIQPDDTALSATRGFVEKPLGSSTRYISEKPATLPGRVSLETSAAYTSRTSLERSTVPSSRIHHEMSENRLSRSLDRNSDTHYKSSRDTESAEVLKSSLDRSAEMKFRSSMDREESRFRSSLDRAETKLRHSLERADAKFRNDLDKEDTKYRLEDNNYSRFSVGKSVSDRSLERKPYNREELDKLRSEDFRTMPDGSIGDKEMPLTNKSRYERSATPDRLSYNTIGLESEKFRYGKDRVSRSEREAKTLSGSYAGVERSTFTTGLADKRREWSRSEADLYSAHVRERSRTPESHTSGPGRAASPISLDRMPVYASRHSARGQYDSPSSRLPKPKYKWDDEATSRRQFTERGDNPDMLTGLSGSNYSRTSPAGMSAYRSKDLYDRDLDKGYEYSRRLPPPPSYAEDNGDLSDTATDILVNAPPYEKQDPSSRLSPDSDRYHRRHGSHNYNGRRRRDSLGSDGSLSDVEDIDGQFYSSGKHLRSKSADGRELSRRSQPIGHSERSSGTILIKSADRSLYKTVPAPTTANFRTVIPPVLTTQHNRNMLSSSTGTLASLTSGLRPFAPRSPGDIQLEDVVKFSRQGGKLSQGIVKYVGHLPGRSDAYLGVELDKEDGKHDGKFEGMRYFRCKPNKGVFVAFNKIVMAWTP